ncbi:MAG TPA: hypothetical protein VG605_20505 [Puia sp.]|nr:hypothetical protein [Puia sp.]
MTTIHQYLAHYPISPTSEKLIVGTIHPHDHASFRVPFFYGNECSLWKILHEAFPDELLDPYQLDAILAFLHGRKIAMSDMILECERTTPAALDEDLIPRRLNHELLDQIRHSNIREILFTSGFGKNAAFKLFYSNILKRSISATIRQEKEILLEPNLFGRPVLLRILYSPSGTANTGLVRSKLFLERKDQFRQFKAPVQAFKVDYYRRMFS